jgi:FlaA1/EpsC-like NDP-sugar epimerase
VRWASGPVEPPRFVVRALRWLRDRPARHRAAGYALVDALAMLASFAVVLWLYDRHCHCLRTNVGTVGLALGFAVASVVIFKVSGLYRPLLRYRDTRLIWRIMRATIPAAALPGWVTISVLQGVSNDLLLFPLWIAMFAFALAWRAAGTSLVAWTIREEVQPKRSRVVIYGAGRAGRQLVEVLLREKQYVVLGFVDDNRDVQRRTLRDLPIHSPDWLRALAANKAVDQIILAFPSIGVARRREIVHGLSELGVRVTTLPSLADIMSGRIAITAIRDVTAEELLSRDAVTPDFNLIAGELTGRSVLVTGGGGSIGSALCREILRHKPRKLVVLDASEHALYAIDEDLIERVRDADSDVEIVPVLCSVLNARALHRTLREHAIEILYHAAAYKHVPLVESNIAAGIENNVFGTLNAAQAAVRNKVRKFVLISTDKAVRPTSIMGASKRMAEMVIDSIAHRHPATRFALVRFGNVLDSAGSVVPRFRRQIMQGGPITVTHPEMVRFFMTIPEAAELVIQAGAMARSRGCDVFHLDMGEPVRVLDLAYRLVSLSGLTVRKPGSGEGDIEIEITGIRPGEKLYEELLVDGEAASTTHPRIFRARDVEASWSGILPALKLVREALRQGDPRHLRVVLARSIGHLDLAAVEEPPVASTTVAKGIAWREAESRPAGASALVEPLRPAANTVRS